MERIPKLHSRAIPIGVMRYLVTCIATASRSHRRCLLPKYRDSDYCCLHQKPIELYSIKQSKAATDNINHTLCTSIPRVDNTIHEPFMSIDRLLNNLRSSLSKTLPFQENTRNWRVQCIEDAFLCERNEPFPLGLNIRRYFPGHGESPSLYYILRLFYAKCLISSLRRVS